MLIAHDEIPAETDVSYHVEILESGADSLHHVLSLGVGRWARVQGGVEAGAHLFDARLELLALEERYKHSLVDFVALGKIKIGISINVWRS